jgi:hypothetical protein
MHVHTHGHEMKDLRNTAKFEKLIHTPTIISTPNTILIIFSF